MNLTITAQGMSAAMAASSSGLHVEITEVGVGSSGYSPTREQTALRSEQERASISQVTKLSDTRKRLAAKFVSDREYAVREVGFYLSDGTLFGVISHPDELLNYKTSQTSCIQELTLDFSVLPVGSVDIVSGQDNLNILIDNEYATLAAAQIDAMCFSVDKTLADATEKAAHKAEGIGGYAALASGQMQQMQSLVEGKFENLAYQRTQHQMLVGGMASLATGQMNQLQAQVETSLELRQELQRQARQQIATFAYFSAHMMDNLCASVQ